MLAKSVGQNLVETSGQASAELNTRGRFEHARSPDEPITHRELADCVEDHRRRNLQMTTYLQKFNHVQMTVTDLVLGNERLRAMQLLSKFPLCHARG